MARSQDLLQEAVLSSIARQLITLVHVAPAWNMAADKAMPGFPVTHNAKSRE